MSDFKDVSIGDEKYRVGRMTALVGSGIMVRLMPVIIPQIKDDKLDVAGIIRMLPEIPFEDFQRYQIEAMKVSYTLVADAPIPVMMVNGKWANKKLEMDPVSVTALTAHALVFNLSPFFLDGGLQKIMQSFQDLNSNPSNSQA